MKAIINGKIVTKNNIIENQVLVFDKTITEISENLPLNCEIIDAKGMYVSPGLIDTHIHGSNGYDIMDDEEDAVTKISESICKNGVTSFLATTMTMKEEYIYKSLQRIKDNMNYNGGAKVLGAHLEGPFINEKYKGAQDPKFIKKPSMEFIKSYENVIKIISYAPEMDEDLVFTKDIIKNTNIKLSIGHSNCTYSLGQKYVDAGVSSVTHLFNAMTPLNHREPGVVGVALTNDDVYCEVIADEIHIDKELYQFIITNKGLDKVVLITDSMRGANLEDGKYDLGGQTVIVKDNVARLENNALAGSVLTLNKAVYNFHKNTNLNLCEAIKLASLNPATSIGIQNSKGSLEVGKDADITIFDEFMNCKMTVVEGKIVHKNL